MENKYEKDFYEYLKKNDYILKKSKNGLGSYNGAYVHKDFSDINNYSSVYSSDKITQSLARMSVCDASQGTYLLSAVFIPMYGE